MELKGKHVASRLDVSVLSMDSTLSRQAFNTAVALAEAGMDTMKGTRWAIMTRVCAQLCILET